MYVISSCDILLTSPLVPYVEVWLKGVKYGLPYELYMRVNQRRESIKDETCKNRNRCNVFRLHYLTKYTLSYLWNGPFTPKLNTLRSLRSSSDSSDSSDSSSSSRSRGKHGDDRFKARDRWGGAKNSKLPCLLKLSTMLALSYRQCSPHCDANH